MDAKRDGERGAPDLREECQLAAFPSALGAGPPSREEPWSWYFARRLRGLRLRLGRSWRALTGTGPDPAAPPAAPGVPTELSPGDLVRVRSAEEIRATLDGLGRLHGCGFTTAMYAFCGREARVLRRVDRFFDEARFRMLRGRHLVILEGIHCDGSHLKATQGCDRMCFLFWRTEWLERVER